jgi:hypothetical protein
MQVQRMGSPATQVEARRILVDARRRMYRLLADDDAADGPAADGPAADAPSADGDGSAAAPDAPGETR